MKWFLETPWRVKSNEKENRPRLVYTYTHQCIATALHSKEKEHAVSAFS